MKKGTLWKVTTLALSGLILSACQPAEEGPVDEPEEVVAPEPDNGDEDNGTVEPDENGETDEEENTGETVSQDLEVWFPRLENVRLEYEGDSMEGSSFTRYPQFVLDDTLQIVEKNAGTHVVTIYEYTDDAIEEIFIRPETYFRENFMDTGLSSEQEGFYYVLQLPIEVGNTWENPNGTQSEITEVGLEMDTPLGTVEAIEVTTTHEDGINTYYYGEDIGLIEVVAHYGEDDFEVISQLVGYHEEEAEEFPVTIYTLDEQALGLDAIPVTMALNTNDPARLALADLMKAEAPDTDYTPMITEGVAINFMYLREDGVVHADFSVELVDEMNAGAGVENMILQGIVNTIGGYYQVDEVEITVDNGAYESGHIVVQPGETLSVDHSLVNE
ncbi:GerMN domain-containing protein [Alkalibacterium iburiense]|uniref:GerMN domain-containing protein n=1 Tax=Alkalibacterium iburiense TaxID=290589 RepID=A0ABN0X423_9LACT